MLGALALAVVVMLPRLASAQFGLLDDGLTIQTGREMHGHWAGVLYLIPETGRFFPAYWLTYSAIWSLVGTRALAFFAVNVLVLASLLAMLGHLVRLAGGTRVAVMIAAVAFALSGPVVESFYTLSKAEPLQLAWVALSLLCTAAAAGDTRRFIGRVGWAALATVALLLAHATKETSVVLVPIAVGWLALERRPDPRNPASARFATIYVAVALVSASAFAILRWRYAALALGEGSYTRAYAFNVITLGPALFRTVAWLVRDFAFVAPLVVVGLLRGRWHRPLAYACVWMLGWLVVYLPWPATFEYHLLPFAFGASLLTGLVIGEIWSKRNGRHGRLVWSVLAICGLLWSVAVVNATVDARVQLAVDRANTGLVDFLATLPRQSEVVLNMTPVNEYHYELPMHLAEIKRRPDIVFVRPGSTTARGGDTFAATAEMRDPPGPTVRIALHEAGVRQDNVALAAAGGERVYHAVEHVAIVEIGIQRLLCRLAVPPVFDWTYCPGDRGVIFRRTFAYGWQVHRLGRQAANAATIRHGG